MKADQRKDADRPNPGNKLTEAECQAILDVCNDPRFQSLPPSQIVPTLLDEGRYIASVSSYYRVLKAANQQHRRGRASSPGGRKPRSYVATGPNQVWSWDITYCVLGIRSQKGAGHRITSLSGICYDMFMMNKHGSCFLLRGNMSLSDSDLLHTGRVM